MSYYDEWADQVLPKIIADKLYGAGYCSYTSYMGKTEQDLLKVLTPNELIHFQAMWGRDTYNYPFAPKDTEAAHHRWEKLRRKLKKQKRHKQKRQEAYQKQKTQADIKFKKDTEKALETLWVKLLPHLTEQERDELTSTSEPIYQIDQYGASGPVGLGLNKFGGHAV